MPAEYAPFDLGVFKGYQRVSCKSLKAGAVAVELFRTVSCRSGGPGLPGQWPPLGFPGLFRALPKALAHCSPSSADPYWSSGPDRHRRKRFCRPEPEDDPFQSQSVTHVSGTDRWETGAGGRNRTADTRIFSPLLYRLSYPGH